MSSRAMVRLGISLAVFLLFLVHVSGLARFRLLDTVDRFSYDARILVTLPQQDDPRVVILDMDERTLAAEGWPLTRDKWAKLITNLFDQYGARVLGFDMTFPEPDRRAAQLLDKIAAEDLADVPDIVARSETIKQKMDYDKLWAESMRGKPIIMGIAFNTGIGSQSQVGTTAGELCAPLMDKSAASLYAVDFWQARGYAANVPVLQQATGLCGFFDNPRQDDDGIFRRVPLVQQHEGAIYPSLALALTRLAVGNPGLEFEFEPPDARSSLNLQAVRFGDVRAPVDGDVAVYVPYRGNPYTYTYVSATDVINGTLKTPDIFRGAIVLMGTSAAGLLDFRVTPVSRVHPGVEVHASIVSGLLDGTIRQQAPYYNGMEFMLLLAVALAMAWGFSRLSAAGSALLTLGMMLFITAIAFGLWDGAKFIMPMGMPLAFTLVLFTAHLLYGYFIESRRVRDISKQFGEYVPPEVVAEMADKGGQISMEGEAREMTVLFSDVRGFTTVSEKLDAKELAQLMNLFLTKQTSVIQKHRGTIDKYMGDAVMAFWGAPLPDKDHALNAVIAGIEMITAVRELDAEFEKRGWPKLNIGVGLNTGKMSVGNMGSEFRRAYTVMGDAVNLGSRVEGLTKKYGVAIMVTENTRAQLPGDWAFRELDAVRVKGKNEPVAIYEPMGPKDKLEPGLRNDLARHRGAMKLYRSQKWDEAEQEFFALQQGPRPHPVYAKFIERIMHLREEPPGANWDGAYTMDEK